MDSQTVFDVLVGLCGALGGWILNAIKSEQIADRRSINELADKVQHIEVLVAGTYVTRVEQDKLANALFTKLDRIEGKLDSKVDKKNV